MRSRSVHSSGRFARTVIFWLSLSLATVVMFAVTKALFFQTFRIVSDSMNPTLLNGDLILVNKFAYRSPRWIRRYFGPVHPQRGDVVVFSRFSEFQPQKPEKHYIKRVVGIPGDTIAVSADGIEIGTSTAPSSGKRYEYGPVELKAGEYFVSGDNQFNSQDSRYYGPINSVDIEGEAVAIIWSIDRASTGARIRWDRFAREL